MPIIKLDAIDSTNDFLKKMAREAEPETFTVVSAKSQTNGRGQMGAKWTSESGKNLIASIFIKNALPDLTQIYNLNIAVALSVAQALDAYDIADILIKWPNDIMAGNRKCGGILIENSILGNGATNCIAGIGLNINQEQFDQLPKATSLKVHTGRYFNIDELLLSIAERMKINTSNLSDDGKILMQEYHRRLFKKDVPMPFRVENNPPFMGIIRGVNATGSLLVETDSGTIDAYGLKEITMLY